MAGSDMPRVLILGDRVEVGLAACRALGSAGYHVGVAGTRAVEEVAASRHAASYHATPSPELDRDRWAETIRALIHAERYDVALATSDTAVASLMDVALGVPACPHLSDDTLHLIDKAQLGVVCRDVGVGYPSSHVSRSRAEDETISQEVAHAMIVKPTRPAVTVGRGLAAMPGARVVHNPAEARDALAEIRRRGFDGMIQGQVFGVKVQGIIIRRHGVTTYRLAFAVRREFPPAHGAEAMLEGLRTADGVGGDVIDAMERLADAARYEGLLGAEFICDASSGKAVVVDVNPRLGGALSYAELLGHRLTERMVRDALGFRSAPLGETGSRRYHHLVREIRWLGAQSSWPTGYFGTFGIRDVWDVPSVTDPRPTLLRVKRRFARR